MDLEFDKEMDALLRRAAGRGVLVGDSPKTHMDADTIAAFAENALPEKSRMIHMQHLAACDPCRKALAGLITLNAEAGPAMAAAAAPIASRISASWYRRFLAPNLAYVMGGLVLVFGGLFGFIVLQNSYQNSTATLSKVADNEPAQSAPARADGANTVAAAGNANSAINAPGEIPRSVGIAEDQIFADADKTGESATATSPPPPVTASNTATLQAKDLSLDGLDKAKAPASQPATQNAPKREEDERAKNEVKLADQEARKQDANAGNIFNTPQNQIMPNAASKSSGPSRNDIQRDNRSFESRTMDGKQKANIAEKPSGTGEGSSSSLRRVGGKSFELKQGAWYDTVYSGQKTKNVRRGTDEYLKLDGGLRSIADSITGTVVLVWKSKAYRIQ